MAALLLSLIAITTALPPERLYGVPSVRYKEALMADDLDLRDDDVDHPDDSSAPRHDSDSIAEETSAAGQRIKGAVKDATGELTGDEALEDKGERENAAGRKRQSENDAV